VTALNREAEQFFDGPEELLGEHISRFITTRLHWLLMPPAS
jgi:hypothetical protein